MNTPNDKTTRTDDDRFVDKAGELFADSVERMDAATRSKLNQRRQAALDEVRTTPPTAIWSRWLPAAGVAAAAVIAVVMLQGPNGVELPEASETAAVDFELLLGDDELEMIEELEFYSWLDSEDLDETDNVG